MLEFRILGPLEVADAGRILALGSPKERTLLAMLIIHASEVVPVDWLVEGLWGETPPSRAVQTLHTYVSHLRGALEGRVGREDRLIERTASGYRLRVDPNQVDARRADGLIARGLKAATGGSWEEASRLLTEALQLWRGPGLVDFLGMEFAQSDVRRLDELRLAAEEARVEADLARGHQLEVIPRLEALTAQYPLREGLQGLLMIALYRAGRQAEALRRYQQTRYLLGEELGVEPSSELRRLEERILLQDPSLRQMPSTQGTEHGGAPGVFTFLLTDIESSTLLWEQHPDEMRVAIAEHNRILHQSVTSHGGRVFFNGGDSIAAVFHRAGQALEAAVDAQLALQDIGVGGKPLLVRMAVHAGEAEESDGNYLGPALNRAGRIRDATHGGQILATGAVRELAPDPLPAQVIFVDLGEHRLRDLARPEQIYQINHPRLPSSFPFPRSLETVRHNLPVQLTSFIGRDGEIAEIKRLVSDFRLVTLTGPGGSGKTRLALQVAADMVDDFRDGIWFLDLGLIYDPNLLEGALAGALGVRGGGIPIAEVLRGYLATKRLLLVIDNCEHFVQQVALLVRDLLTWSPDLRLLATSRERLGIGGEMLYPLPPWPIPDTTVVADHLMGFDAIQLFVERASVVHPGFSLSDKNSLAVVAIVKRLDGMPLSIELAAARMRMFTADQIASRLDDRFDLLADSGRTTVARHRTLRAATDWSHDLLDPHERVLFRRLSVFSGSFAISAVEQVCGAEDFDPIQVLELLTLLVDKSLVTVVSNGEELRCRLLDTLRQYAFEKLEAAGESESFRARHAANYQEMVKDLPGLEHQLEVYDLYGIVDSDIDNLREALRWAIDSRHGHLAADLVCNLGPYWFTRGLVTEGRAWAEQVLAGQYQLTSRDSARLLAYAGAFAGSQQDFERALSLMEQAVSIFRTIGDRENAADTLREIASARSSRGEYQEARRDLEQARMLFDQVGDDGGAADCDIRLAYEALGEADFERASNLVEQAVSTLHRVHDNEAALARPHFDLTVALWIQRDPVKAIHLLKELSEADRSDSPLESGQNFEEMGLALWMQGHLEAARQHLQRALGTYRDLGDRRGIARNLLELGVVAATAGDDTEAARLIGAGEEVNAKLGTVIPRIMRPVFDKEVQAIRARLGEEQYIACLSHGKAVALDQVLSHLAMSPSGRLQGEDNGDHLSVSTENRSASLKS